MCKTMAIKADGAERVLRQSAVQSNCNTIFSELQLLGNVLHRIQQFIQRSLTINIVERLLKKNSYRMECTSLITELESAIQTLQFALQLNMHNRMENMALQIEDPRLFRERARKAVQYASLRDYQTSVVYLKNNPVTNDMGTLTKRFAATLKEASDVHNADGILDTIFTDGTLAKAVEEYKICTQAEYDHACMLFKSGNLKQALEEFNKMAVEYPEAYFRIGQIYHQPSPFLQECAKREGVEPDYRKAVSHYYMAHRLGCDRGLPFLGSILLKGLTGQPNRESAKSILNLGVNSQDKDTALYCRQSLAQF